MSGGRKADECECSSEERGSKRVIGMPKRIPKDRMVDGRLLPIKLATDLETGGGFGLVGGVPEVVGIYGTVAMKILNWIKDIQSNE